EPGTTAASTVSDLTRSSASATVAASTTSKAPVSVTTAIALPTAAIFGWVGLAPHDPADHDAGEDCQHRDRGGDEE
ncbi:hypothetical protein, partial [Salinibacterium sp.]|uniref:hypothetical protein n=1 Tax=Salinibacterium sp. TaxID=1915057 RepID=UPI00286C6F70